MDKKLNWKYTQRGAYCLTSGMPEKLNFINNVAHPRNFIS